MVACWLFILNLHLYDLLTDRIAKLKIQGAKEKQFSKTLRVMIWILLTPLFSALIVSFFYAPLYLSCIFFVILILCAMFLSLAY